MPIVSIQELHNVPLDYLIIGGGTSGLTLATRLSENENLRVGVLEAGGSHLDADEVNIPGFLGKGIANSKFDWTFFTVPQEHAGGQPILVPRGKGLGGSSALNFMGACRPAKDEIDALERLGNPGWNWDSLLPYFKKSETAVPSTHPGSVGSESGMQTLDPEWHGSSGPIKKSLPTSVLEVHDYFIDSISALGIPKTSEMSDGSNVGVITQPVTVDPRTAKRSYAASEYFAPNASRTNLMVVIDAHVTRVIFSKTQSGTQRATGVEVLCSGSTFRITGIKKDIVVSAGAYQTPQVLELSGVGDATILRDHGIEPIIDLPGVGENLQDHICVRSIVEVDKSVDTFDILRDASEAQKHLELYHQQKGLMASVAAPGYAFVSAQQLGFSENRIIWDKLNQGFSHNNIPTDKPTLLSGLKKQYAIQQDWLDADHLSQAEIIDFLGYNHVHNISPPLGKRYITVVGVGPMRPLSRGSVHIASAEALTAPAIDPKFFSNDSDLVLLVETLKFCTKIIDTAPLSDIVRSHVVPGPEVLAPGEDLDNRLREYVKNYSGPTYHPIGTAAMLPLEDGGVVDSTLKVYGTENLRVVDVSILPMMVATHTQMLAYAIAEKAADIFENN